MNRLLPTVAPALALGCCAPATPDARIAAQPALYEALDSEQRELVRQGRIARGMPPSAVYLAWGAADRRYEGSDEGVSTRRWDYFGSEPVTTTSFGAGYGWGPYYGPRGYWGYPGAAFAYSPAVTYLPYRAATVWFENDRVAKWESSR